MHVVAVILLLVGPLGGFTFIGYIVLWIVLPEAPATAAQPHQNRDRGDTGFIVSIGLLAIGAWLLLGRVGWIGMGWMLRGWFPGFIGGPLVLITLGLIVVMLSRRKQP